MSIKKFFIFGIGAFLLFALLSAGQKGGEAPKAPDGPDAGAGVPGAAVSEKGGKRSFFLGFTQWPPSFDLAEVESMYAFHKEYADLSVYHQVEGIAWQEALEGKEYPKRLQDNWNFVKSRFPKNRPVYLALTPLNDLRTGLANYANDKGDQESLPEPWKNFPLNQPEVKTAYLNYAKAAVDFFHPDFLAIDIESNVLLSKNEKKWREFLELHEYIYFEIKKAYPELTVFSTVQYEHLNATQPEASGKGGLQKAQAEKLLQTSDLLALSIYPYTSKIKPVEAGYFDLALSFKKPIAIAETGYASGSFSIYGYRFDQTPEDQRQYFETLFQVAEARQFRFIVNFAAFDYTKLQKSLPEPVRELAGVWVYTGMRDDAGKDKPAFELWKKQVISGKK